MSLPKRNSGLFPNDVDKEDKRIAIVASPYGHRNNHLAALIASRLVENFVGAPPAPRETFSDTVRKLTIDEFTPPLITIDSLAEFTRPTYTVNDQADICPVSKEPSKLLVGLIKRI